MLTFRVIILLLVVVAGSLDLLTAHGGSHKHQ
jgi:hypothetical protein